MSLGLARVISRANEARSINVFALANAQRQASTCDVQCRNPCCFASHDVLPMSTAHNHRCFHKIQKLQLGFFQNALDHGCVVHHEAVPLCWHP
jgi:hypothetical protein